MRTLPTERCFTNHVAPGSSKPFQIGVYYLVSLVLLTGLCVWFFSEQTILAYASKSKPYLFFLADKHCGNLPNGHGSKQVICFGDSNSFYPTDMSADSGDFAIHIPGLLREATRARGLRQEVSFSEWAFAGADMFDYYCLYFRAVKSSPDLIIVPINWRSFGPEWLDESMWFHPELSGFVPINDRFNSSRENPVKVNGISLFEQIAYHITYPFYLYPLGIKNWTLDHLQSVFRTSVQEGSDAELVADKRAVTESMPERAVVQRTSATDERFVADADAMSRRFPRILGPTNPTFLSFRALADTASECGTKVLFYIWPLDRQFMEKLLVFDENAFILSKRVITNLTDREGIYFVDLSSLLEHRFFYDMLGHCSVEGRKRIAEALAPSIIAILEEGPDSGG